ncbi:MAG: L-histidine N-alpha-methyltransferase [Patiriisocius sp.]|jgi:L-histidine N-alpha-methyltransferase
MIEEFKKDVDSGLSSKPKVLSSKYFYDKVGDKLFVDIMNMPEYYLTNAEYDIFKNQTVDLIKALKVDLNRPFELIELGAGDGTKTVELLSTLIQNNYDFEYLPVDISQNALDGLEKMLGQRVPELIVKKKQGDYFDVLSAIKDREKQKVILFLGSNIGNLSDELAEKFIYGLGSNLNKGDMLLIGIDLIKSADIVLPAYNDAAGITSKFNMNLLTRINRELEGDFDLSAFEHRPEYTEEDGVARSFLVSTKDQSVRIGAIDKTFGFTDGEKIATEISRKYNDQVISKIIANTDFVLSEKLVDSNNYFADYILLRN